MAHLRLVDVMRVLAVVAVVGACAPNVAEAGPEIDSDIPAMAASLMGADAAELSDVELDLSRDDLAVFRATRNDGTEQCIYVVLSLSDGASVAEPVTEKASTTGSPEGMVGGGCLPNAFIAKGNELWSELSAPGVRVYALAVPSDLANKEYELSVPGEDLSEYDFEITPGSIVFRGSVPARIEVECRDCSNQFVVIDLTQ